MDYDVAILGMGTMGSFTAMELLDRGASVIGFDRFTPPHRHGSHSGQTRLFRIAYPEGSGYVSLAQQAGHLWDDLNNRFGVKLLHRSGMLYMGPEHGEFLNGFRESARVNQLRLEVRNAREVRRDFPAFQLPDEYAGLLDPLAGWIDVDASIHQVHENIRTRGAAIHLNSPAIEWSANGQGGMVRMETGEFRAGKLVVCAGAWATRLLADLKLPIVIRRKVLTWFNPLQPELFEGTRIPVFTFPENSIYGFPNSKGIGVKLAEHIGGADLSSADDPVAVPGDLDIDSIRATASKYVPALMGPPPGHSGQLLNAVTCLYSLTPDENFIIGLHPGHEQVVIAAGFSGHGFKFAPLMAIALADLTLKGTTTLPIGFLGINRLFGK